MVRSCYRSYWRLHEDKTILTPGRYYFCGDDVPFAPFPTLRGSRIWDEEDQPAKVVREWGEWDGPQKWDSGAKPEFLPVPRLVGSRDCISKPASGNDAFPGIPVDGSMRTVCIGGVVYSFPAAITVSFNVGYQDAEWTYYNDVPLYLVESDCEARYEGASGIPSTKAIVRVTAGVEPGSLNTNFYLCESAPNIETMCCEETGLPRVFYGRVKLWKGPIGFPPTTLLATWTNIVLTHDGSFTWRSDPDDPAAAVVGGKMVLNAFCYSPGLGNYGILTFLQDAVDPVGDYPTGYIDRANLYIPRGAGFDCDPFHLPEYNTTVTSGAPFDGFTLTGSDVWKIYFELNHEPF